METLKFKTNIKCAGCVATVKPKLDAIVGIGHWEVETQDPDKILTITAPVVNIAAIQEGLGEVGYYAVQHD